MDKPEHAIKCPHCHAEPGQPCGIDSHPERIQAHNLISSDTAWTLPAEMPKKKAQSKKRQAA